MKTLNSGRAAERTLVSDVNANFADLDDDFLILPITASAAGTFVVPKGYRVTGLVIENTTANAVTGGLKVGTTLGGTDVIAAQAVGASALVDVLRSDILKRIFSKTANQTLYFDAVTAWNSASLNIRVILEQVF